MKNVKRGFRLTVALFLTCAMLLGYVPAAHAASYSADARSAAQLGGNGYGTVLAAVTLSAQPKNASVFAGEQAVFKVTATGTGTLQYQWQTKAPGATEWKNSTSASAKKATFNLTAQAGHNGYQFRCIVKDGSGSSKTSSAATLTVKQLAITTQPKSVGKLVGETASFKVVATGQPTVTYQWQTLAPKSTTWKNSTSASAKKATFNITVQAGHNGYKFRCIVTDGSGQSVTSDAATLSIRPEIAEQPKNATVAVTSTATFSVTVTGGSQLTYQWQTKAPSSDTWKDSTSASAKKATFSISTKAAHQGYRFRCIVKDEFGNELISDAAKLTLRTIPVTDVYFPDDIFRQYVSESFDTDQNGKLSLAELQAVTEINVAKMGIGDLKGVEFFTKLEKLDCSGATSMERYKAQSGIEEATQYYWKLESNYILSLNLSCNTELRQLRCGRNRLVKLDVSRNTKLVLLECQGLYYYDSRTKTVHDYRLTKLNVSKNKLLEELDCSNNLLTSLNLGNNKALKTLRCSQNDLTSINVSPCADLEQLFCGYNRLTSLDVTNNAAMTVCECFVNELTELDVSQNTELGWFYCSYNRLEDLDLSHNKQLYRFFYGFHVNDFDWRANEDMRRWYWDDKYGLTDDDIALMWEIIEECTDESMNRVEKIKAIHDWIVVNTYYDLTYTQHNAHEVLNDHIAVCSGYTRLFSAFMDLLLIPNVEVRGYNHAFNAVRLEDGQFYYVDCTWDDPLMNNTSDYTNGYNLRYTYFLVGLPTMLRQDSWNHLPDEEPVDVSFTDCNWRSFIGAGN